MTDDKTAFVQTYRMWKWQALPGAFSYLVEGYRGNGVRFFWEVWSGRIRVNGHELLHWKFL